MMNTGKASSPTLSNRIGRTCARGAGIAGVVLAALFAPPLSAQTAPVTTCDNAGIGSATLISDLPTLPSTVPPGDTSVTITSVTTGTTGSGIPYCLVKVLVKPAINIWVGLPTDGKWNGRLQSEGGGGYAGGGSAYRRAR